MIIIIIITGGGLRAIYLIRSLNIHIYIYTYMYEHIFFDEKRYVVCGKGFRASTFELLIWYIARPEDGQAEGRRDGGHQPPEDQSQVIAQKRKTK